MSTSKLTIVAQLRDELSAPLKKVIKGLDEAADAAAKGAVSADRQADAFNRLAKEAGWSQNKLGKWVNESNRLVSKTDRAAMGISALSLATRDAADATRKQEQAFNDVVKAAGYKIASDGSVRNALGLFVKKQHVATMQTMAAANVTRMATASSKDYGEEAVRTARHATLMNKSFSDTVKEMGYAYDAHGKLVNGMGRVMAASDVTRLKADASAWATHRMGQTAEQAANETGRAAEKVDYFSTNAVRAGTAVDRFAKSLGMSDENARKLGTGLATAMQGGEISAGVASFKAKLDSIHDHAKGVAGKIESAMGKALKVGGVAAGAGAAYAVVGGFERLGALEMADAKLQVQDFSKEDREGIKAEVDEMVQGTLISLPQGLNTAQGLLGSGVDYGAEFTEKMGTIIDAQSVYSSHDPAQLELVMRQIESKEILTGEERNQLAELGMPINEWLAAEMDIPTSEVMDAIEAKEVTADVWWKAMGTGVDEAAELMGNTFVGQWGMFKTAVKRSGQFFDAPLIEPMKRALKFMTDYLDDNQAFFTKLGEAAAVGMSEAADTIPQVLAALEPLGPAVIRFVNALAPMLPQLVQGFANWLQVITPLVIALLDFTTILMEVTGPLLPVLIPLLMGTLAVLHGYSILKGISNNWDKFGKVLSKTGWIVTGLKWGFDLLTRSIMMFPGMWIVAAIILVIGMLGMLYDNVEWVRTAFDAVADTIKWIIDLFDDLIGKADSWMSKKLGLEDNGTAKDAQDQMDIRPEWWKNATRPMEESLGVGAAWGSGQGLFRFMHGSDSRDEEGNPIGTPALPEMAGSDAMTQIEERLTPLPGSADQSVPGLADGGWTAPGTINVGERGREFITSAWAANQVETNTPGAMQYINDTGNLPPTGGVNVQAKVDIHGVNDPGQIREIVMAAIRDAAREAEREYMNAPVRGAG